MIYGLCTLTHNVSCLTSWWFGSLPAWQLCHHQCECVSVWVNATVRASWALMKVETGYLRTRYGNQEVTFHSLLVNNHSLTFGGDDFCHGRFTLSCRPDICHSLFFQQNIPSFLRFEISELVFLIF